MGRSFVHATCSALLFGSLSVPAAAGIDPDSLRLERTPGEVRLSWSGDGPAYVVYRGAEPAGVDAPANEIGRTTDNEYVDALSGMPCESCFYLVRADDSFACWDLTCSSTTEYCFILFPGVPESPPQPECKPLPRECLPRPTCPCVEDAVADEWPPPSAECQQDRQGAITIGVYAP